MVDDDAISLATIATIECHLPSVCDSNNCQNLDKRKLFSIEHLPKTFN